MLLILLIKFKLGSGGSGSLQLKKKSTPFFIEHLFNPYLYKLNKI